MTWTNFTSAGIGPITTPQLDANFLTLSGLVNIPVTVSGTNTLILTSTAGTATLTGYQDYMNLYGVAAATNTGPVVVNFNSFGGKSVYKDTTTGPQLLSGGEIIQNCQLSLMYDSTLGASAGGFHLVSSSSSLVGQSITIAGLQVGTSITNAVTRLYSTLASISFGVLAGSSQAQATVSFSGCQVLDNVIIGLPAAPTANVLYTGFVLAAGSIGVRAFNNNAAATVTLALTTFRVTNLGFVS